MGNANLAKSYYSLEFGTSLLAKALKVTFVDTTSQLEIRWAHG